MTSILFSTITLAIALLASRWVRDEGIAVQTDRWESALRKFGPLGAAIISVAVVWWVWGQVVPVPVIQDEASYLLQAEIFARGRWTAPTPPLPEFFEQPHVLIVPAVASKYPPGHALILTIGMLAGFPALMPLLLTGVTAALFFALAARVTNVWIALLGWSIWISAPIVLRFQPSYMSELTTTPLVLASWWALLQWRETGKRRWMVLMAIAIGWGAITRPYTMLAVAIPVGVVVMRQTILMRRWRELVLGIAVGTAVLSILPLWSARTTGDWNRSPVELYRRDYLPFDRLGFQTDTTPPQRWSSMSLVLRETHNYILNARRQQQAESLPQIALRKVIQFAISLFQGGRLPLLAFAIAGLFFLRGPLAFAAYSALVVFIAYLAYPYWPGWTVYYLEIAPVAAMVTAVGIWRAAVRIGTSERRGRLAAALATLAIVGIGVPIVDHWRAVHRETSRPYRDFARMVERLPEQPGILFVRYSPRVARNIAVVRNFADLSRAPVWVVHDLGDRNAELVRQSAGRAAHHFDADSIVRD